jgi:hypothetical protein
MPRVPPFPADDLATNKRLAANLRELADLLEQQQADGFRVAAYRRAADVVDGLAVSAERLLAQGGRKALEALPAIGRGIAAAICEMIVTGRWSQLQRLRGSLDPEALFRTLPGIGPQLASRICSALHLESLAALESAAYDGRLERLAGFGPRRLQMVRSVLAERLGRPRARILGTWRPRPDIATLLDVDAEYRRRAEAGTLPTIAPKRFNPQGAAWLPILHTDRGPWQFTALYSNTRQAHELGRVRDWVVVYYQTDEQPEGQCTLVTERRGELAGQRVVRGREAECLAQNGKAAPAVVTAAA